MFDKARAISNMFLLLPGLLIVYLLMKLHTTIEAVIVYNSDQLKISDVLSLVPDHLNYSTMPEQGTTKIFVVLI